MIKGNKIQLSREITLSHWFILPFEKGFPLLRKAFAFFKGIGVHEYKQESTEVFFIVNNGRKRGKSIKTPKEIGMIIDRFGFYDPFKNISHISS